MKVELDTKEALFVAKALKAYAGESLENMNGPELTQAEKTGRKVCSRFLESLDGKKADAMELEEAFNQAREAFCGIGNDSDL